MFVLLQSRLQDILPSEITHRWRPGHFWEPVAETYAASPLGMENGGRERECHFQRRVFVLSYFHERGSLFNYKRSSLWSLVLF